MPGGDGTGPRGMGAGTGWGRGGCAAMPGAGFGRGMGRGFARGFSGAFAPADPQAQLSYLENVQKNVLAQIESIKAALGKKD